jgi:allantoinase
MAVTIVLLPERRHAPSSQALTDAEIVDEPRRLQDRAVIDVQHRYLGALPSHGRFGYRPITHRLTYQWPGGARLAVYLGFNVEHFAFGECLGAGIGPISPQPDVLNYSWREYGNRVGAWRCLELFDQLGMPCGALINTALYDHCPELLQAMVARGDELIGHGHTNAERQGSMPAAAERELLAACRQRMRDESGQQVQGWLSPWISESLQTPDLLAETGYRYTPQLVPRRPTCVHAHHQRADALGSSVSARAQ